MGGFLIPATLITNCDLKRKWQGKVTNQDRTTIERMRNRIRESLEINPNAPIANPKKYRFVKQDEMPPEYRRVSVTLRLTLPTYHRIAEVMTKNQCGMSDAVEAMLQDVEAQRVMPLDPKWKDKYATKKKTLWQSFDLYRTAGLRKRKHAR